MDEGSRYKPLSVPRYSGLATFMRLTLVPDPSEVDIVLIGVEATITEARRVVGDGPTYVSFDIDSRAWISQRVVKRAGAMAHAQPRPVEKSRLDPAFAPGTGTPEVGVLAEAGAERKQ